MLMEDPVHYCKIITALSETIRLQQKSDDLYIKIGIEIIQF